MYRCGLMPPEYAQRMTQRRRARAGEPSSVPRLSPEGERAKRSALALGAVADAQIAQMFASVLPAVEASAIAAQAIRRASGIR